VKRPALLALALLASPLAAQQGPQPYLAQGETIETELRADLNGDGNADLAYVAAKEGQRELRVVVSYVSETDFGELPAQVLALDADPLADASLSVKGQARGRVLIVQELAGGTTAVASTHRFRWDEKLGAMRLIGLDATLYSRTFAHDGQVASWNLLTGDLTHHRLKLRNDGSDIAYDEVDKERKRKPSPPLRLEDSPSGDELLGWPMAGPDG
jgi:hypothetical protein